MKGITPVIAVILLLLITVSLAGVAIVFFSRTTENAAEGVGGIAEHQLTQIGTDLRIESTAGNKVYIRNTGSVDLPAASVGFYVNDALVAASGAGTIKPGEVAEFTLNTTLTDYTLTVTGGKKAVGAVVKPLPGVTTTTTTTTLGGMSFTINSVDKNTASVTNTGTLAISSVTCTVAGEPVNCTTPPIPPSGSGTVTLDDGELAMLPDPALLEITSGGFTANMPGADFYGAYTAGYWKFDEGSGATADDSSSNSNVGAVTAGTWTAGKYGSALDFDGASSVVTIAPHASMAIGTTYTVSAWIRPDVVSGNHGMFADNYLPDMQFSVFGSSLNGRAYMARSGSWGNFDIPGPAGSVTAGAWQHVTFTVSGTSLKLYRNGVLDASTTIAATDTTAGSSSSWIGYIGMSWADLWFDGAIVEVRVLTVARSMA